ncbi:ATP-dependent DNA helicase [Clostridium sp. AF19-22AC]|uniref:ATP-dependent DNA helicase n=1 Tax=Clostridia TaxID=186801 RepID=UPI000E482C63|nr:MULTISPECIES: ATP-dependent DNA helicase [Clostridia]RHR25857.1 ATP-dependent DNA helicase [Clostridium sp. AF19-22AC]
MYKKQCLIQAHKEIEDIFRKYLPECGMSVREEQLNISHRMLDALASNNIALCDAGVGIGKTYAYLTACAIWKKYSGFTTGYCSGELPVVISTSSIALQKAIMEEYIPFLSDLLLRYGILNHPLQAVIRKGKEHFVCDSRLETRLHAVEDKNKNEAQKRALLELHKVYDMDMVHGISGFDRRQVCVPKHCPRECLLWESCRYQNYLRRAVSPEVFIQICNHNYLLADAIHRQQMYKPLLKPYQALIIDEAHKLPEAARQMYGMQMGRTDMADLCRTLENEQYTQLARKLREAFQLLLESVSEPKMKEDCAQLAFILSAQRRKALTYVIRWLERIQATVGMTVPRWISNRLEHGKELLHLFLKGDSRYILYLEYELSEYPIFCAGIRENGKLLREQIWDQGVPAVLTSGTLMAGDGFERTRQITGLSGMNRVMECVAKSPFCYKENCLLYFPDIKRYYLSESEKEVKLLAEQIFQLICATHGHTLVLFTSYSLMGNIYRELRGRVRYPLLKVWKNSQNVITEFKEKRNSVLFAAGSCWEGVDFPGDSVSSLIIVKLPFSVPNPISEAEREEYPSLHDYIRKIVVPDMQRKLRQGFGRAIRTETDTCVVSILDPRASMKGRYHQDVLDALPECAVTHRMMDVENFIRKRKGILYYL